LSITLRQGSRFACWNAMPAILTGPVTSLPSIDTVPFVGRCSPVTSRISVDLPQPEGPTTAANSPFRTESVDIVLARARLPKRRDIAALRC
jgi:hypothetical protein